jgi:hypothetical protein
VAYASLAEVKLYRGISTATSGTSACTSDDALLTTLIGAAQAQVDAYTGRVFEASTSSTRSYDAIEDVSADGRTLYLDADLAEVTTITNGSGDEVTEYVTVPVNTTPYYAIKIKASADELWTYTDDAEGAISVRGKWAYSTTAPADIKQATIRMAAYLYAQKDVSTFDVTMFQDAGVMTVPQGMPRDVQEILRPYRRIR